MNTEQERSDFTNAIAKLVADQAVVVLGESEREKQMAMAVEWVTNHPQNHMMWLTWQAAKEHAKEMAKPVFTPAPYNGGWGVQDIVHKYWHTLPSKARSIEFALNQGYRIL